MIIILLNKKKLQHCDLHPENIMVEKHDEENAKKIKLLKAPSDDANGDFNLDKIEILKYISDEVDEVDEVDAVDEVGEVDEVDAVDDVGEVDEVDEVDAVDEVGEVDEVDEVNNLLYEYELKRLYYEGSRQTKDDSQIEGLEKTGHYYCLKIIDMGEMKEIKENDEYCEKSKRGASTAVLKFCPEKIQD